MKQSEVLKLGDGRHNAARGLYLEVKNNGRSRVWLYFTKINGKRKCFGLGSAFAVRLQQAVNLANEYRSKIALGLDPRPQKVDANFATSHLVKDIYFEAMENRRVSRNWKGEGRVTLWKQLFRKYVGPAMGNKDVADVTREDVLALLSPLWKSMPPTAEVIRQCLEHVFHYAAHKGLRPRENPAVWKHNLDMELPSFLSIHVTEHWEAPTLRELQSVSFSLMNGSVYEKMVLFGILTACRNTEFREATWDEIDWENRVWYVPPDRRKDRKPYPHRVPLSNQAIDLLLSLNPPVNSEKSAPIFPGKRTKFSALNTPQRTLIRSVRRKLTMHGCRSTFRDWAAENGKSDLLAEKSIMHKTGNNVVVSYQRSDLLEQRRPLMQEWADVLFSKPDTREKFIKKPAFARNAGRS